MKQYTCDLQYIFDSAQNYLLKIELSRDPYKNNLTEPKFSGNIFC